MTAEGYVLGMIDESPWRRRAWRIVRIWEQMFACYLVFVVCVLAIVVWGVAGLALCLAALYPSMAAYPASYPVLYQIGGWRG